MQKNAERVFQHKKIKRAPLQSGAQFSYKNNFFSINLNPSNNIKQHQTISNQIKLMNILLASTSTLFGGKYLEYIKKEIQELFSGIDEIIFVPFARPGGISHDDYTEIARNFFAEINIKVKGLHEFEDKISAINEIGRASCRERV